MNRKRLLLTGVIVLFNASILLSCSNDDNDENEKAYAELQATGKDETDNMGGR